MHLLRVQGFYFSTPQNSAQGFAVAFPAICRVLPLLCNGASCYTAPPATRRSVSQRCNTSSIYSRYHRHAGRYAGQHSRPIIIRYIRVRPVIDPCPAVQHSADHASGGAASASGLHPVQGSARRLVIWHRSAVRAHRLTRSTRQGRPAARARWAARNHWRLAAASLFGLSPDS